MNCIYCKKEIFQNQNYCTGCGKKIPASKMEFIIADLFRKSHCYEDMISYLYISHGIAISLSTLKRKLRSYGLQRRKQLEEHEIAQVEKLKNV